MHCVKSEIIQKISQCSCVTFGHTQCRFTATSPGLRQPVWVYGSQIRFTAASAGLRHPGWVYGTQCGFTAACLSIHHIEGSRARQAPIGGGLGEGVGSESELCTRCQEPGFWLGQLTEHKNDPSLMVSCGCSMGVSHLCLPSPACFFPCLVFLIHHGSLDPLLPICDDLERAGAFLPTCCFHCSNAPVFPMEKNPILS